MCLHPEPLSTLSGQSQPAWDHAHLWRLPPDHPALGGGKKRRCCPPSWTRCCQVKGATCSNWMNFGASWAAKPPSFGSGWRCAAAPARSWAGLWVTEACQERMICGHPWLRATGVAPPAAITGMLRCRVPRTHPSPLRQRGRRDLPRRTLLWHLAGQRQPPSAPGLLLFQARREPPRRHPPLRHHLQPRHPTQSNNQVATTIKSCDKDTRLYSP